MSLVPTYLSRPGVVSSLGCGIEATVAALLDAGAPSPLVRSDAWVQGRTLPVGQVREPLRAFPADLPAQHLSHNNRLLWHALAAVESTLQHAIEKFGAERVGVVLGTSTSGVDENLPAFRHVLAGGGWADSGFSQARQLLSAPVDFVEHQYGLGGIAFGISTACTSGARALISAARLLRSGACDAVLCGGVDMLSLLTINGFAALEVLSDDIARPFAASRNGINIGEAAAVFLMTREPLADGPAFAGARPIALLGHGASSDAWHMSSPRPDGAGAALAIGDALRTAGLTAADIGWVNLHGTGTVQNDAMESRALVDCLGEAVPCTSTKPLTGHTLGAAGALEAAILWGIIDRGLNPAGLLPAQHGGHPRDPALAPLHLAGPDSRWPADARRVGLSTSFAFGGNNTALVLGECG